MSHWHHASQPVSVRSLVQRCAKTILLDRSIEASKLPIRALATDVLDLKTDDPSGKLSFYQVVRLCQEMHAFLITSNADVVPALMTEGRAAWGAILLPTEHLQQKILLSRLLENQLKLKKAGDLGFITASCCQNRLLIDVRQSRPAIGIFFSSKWNRVKD